MSKNTIIANTLSVLQNPQDSILCGIDVNGDYINVTLRFDRGELPKICGYAQDWAIYDECVDHYDDESPMYEQLIEEDDHDLEDFSMKVYISRNDEKEIMVQLKKSLEGQFEDEMFKDTLTEDQKQDVLSRMNSFIAQ